MICARCGSETSRMTCESCGEIAALERRWRLDRVLANRPWATTWQGRDLATRSEVVVEAYPRPVDEAVLQSATHQVKLLMELEHPGVVDYLGLVQADLLDVPHLCTVHAYVRGWNLLAEADASPHTEGAVLSILTDLLETLTWLHSRPATVVHGGIQPANIIRRELDRRLVILDFMGVRDAIRAGSTSPPPLDPGYNAPEQVLEWPASPSTDLWALGAVAVRLLSGRDPVELWDGKELRWQDHVFTSPDLMLLLSDLLQVDPARRPSRASDVLDFVRELS